MINVLGFNALKPEPLFFFINPCTPTRSLFQADDSGDGIPAAALQPLSKYDPPEIGDSSKRRMSTPWSRDMWGMGCIVWEVFNGPLPAPRNLGKSQNKVMQEVPRSNLGKKKYWLLPEGNEFSSFHFPASLGSCQAVTD